MSVPSLQQSDVLEAMVQRIEGVDGGAQPQWGRMNSAQMMSHCQKPFEVAFGEVQLKRGWIGKLFGGMAKKKFIDTDAPFNKNSPTMPELVDPQTDDFEGNQAGLVAFVRRYGKGEKVIGDHPFFGKLTPGDWDRLLWKHLDHHMRQFGQ